MAHILELPYQGGDISMFILLPPFTKEDGIETILKRLTLEKFKAITQSSNLNARTVQVALPKFSLEHTLELVPVSGDRFVVSLVVVIVFSLDFGAAWCWGSLSKWC